MLTQINNVETDFSDIDLKFEMKQKLGMSSEPTKAEPKVVDADDLEQ